MDKKRRILITGAGGQIGSELLEALRAKFGGGAVVALDKKPPPKDHCGLALQGDVTNYGSLYSIAKVYDVGTVYHLASILSAEAERNPETAWMVNVGGLRNVLALAHELGLAGIWPSSIAAFGPGTPKDMTPQETILGPSKIYGITKVAGELLCRYEHERSGVDIRSVRYPGIVSWKTPPGGGTTDYSVEIFGKALSCGAYECPLRGDTMLPMMYIEDAVRAALEIMDAPEERITVRTSYNLSAMSFTPIELADAIRRAGVPLKATYVPGKLQEIADSWVHSMDDSRARADWGWKHSFDLEEMVAAMLAGLQKKN